ncbi:MAG: hypothetical protein QM638_04295 [Nocardioides sp.]|uniref:hypothetical protein n=1 Tax=Nocardioides sp. TaxID=35761 RepID=UPI0039E55B32
MTVCETCGAEGYRSFTLTTDDGQHHVFDSLECAAQVLAPACPNCGVRILGHGVGDETHVFCCAACARAMGVTGVVDHVTSGS